jgi:hypothetical protein
VAKGGLANVLFVQAAVEDLPPELDGIANEVCVNFPWGSLLRAVAGGDCDGLSNLRRICAPEARLKIFLSLDPERDHTEIERLGLTPLTAEFLETALKARYTRYRLFCNSHCERFSAKQSFENQEMASAKSASQ